MLHFTFFFRVDIYGKCGPLSCGKRLLLGKAKQIDNGICDDLINTKYPFTIAFENSICKDYATEKTFKYLKLVKCYLADNSCILITFFLFYRTPSLWYFPGSLRRTYIPHILSSMRLTFLGQRSLPVT